MKKLVVLTGAGVSADSGISTFRDSGGLWNGHDINDVATPQAWSKNPQRVLDFYNERRQQLIDAQPNDGHYALVELEKFYDVQIITQNIDDLHERAGSTNILHLHGELLKVRSTNNPRNIYDWKEDLHMGNVGDDGAQLRPHIVWFGEQVPMMNTAIQMTIKCDLFVVVGTSLVVYPAASLIDYVGYHKPKYIVDPSIPELNGIPNIVRISKRACEGVPELVEQLIAHEKSTTG